MEMLEVTAGVVNRSISQWIEKNQPDSSLPHEDWNSIQFLSSLDDSLDAARNVISSGANVNHQNHTQSVPSLSPLHIAVSGERIYVAGLLIKSKCDLDIVDQWGFTALHYAVLKRNKELILMLIDGGATASKQSKVGSTPLDLARALKFSEIEDILSSKLMSEIEPTLPKFKEWLCHLGAGEYVTSFLTAGYDLPFIIRAGLVDADLDCVGIPMSKLGIRKKIIALHDLDLFYKVADEKKEEEEESDDEEEEEEDSEESEEES